MKNFTKVLFAMAFMVFLAGCTVNPVVEDNSRTGINDVRTYVIDGNELLMRESGVQDRVNY